VDSGSAQNRRGLWIQWIFANTLGWISGGLVGYGTFLLLNGDSRPYPPGHLGWLLVGAVIGFLVGMLQKLAFYQCGIAINGWVRATIVGLAASLYLVTGLMPLLLFGDYTVYLILAVGFGLPLGWLQAQALRQVIPGGTGSWIVGSVIGGAALLFTSAIPAVTTTSPILCFAGPVLYGVLTGAVLVRLLPSIQPAPREDSIFDLYPSPRSAPARRARTQSPPPPAIRRAR